MTSLALIPAMIMAIVCHEVAHGWTALALGDATAKEQRRLRFNLLPIPPWDGSHIVEALLPEPAARAYAGLRRYALVLMTALLLIVPQIFPQWAIVQRFVLPPVDWLQDRYFALAQWIAGR